MKNQLFLSIIALGFIAYNISYSAIADESSTDINMSNRNLPAQDPRSVVRKEECFSAFGDNVFCDCINKLIAPGLTFADYIFVITKSKKAVGYDLLPEENQAMIDSAYSARKLCVK